MLRLIFKALIVIWPWLKTAIFKEGTVAEVVAENKHLTFMLVLIVVLILSLVITTSALSDYKEDYRAVIEKMKESQYQCVPEDVELRKQRLTEMLAKRQEQ